VASASRITIATANIGGVFFAIGGRIAKLIVEHTKIRAIAAETGGSGTNIQQLVSGDYDMALSVASVADNAVAGKGLFDGKPQPIRALTRLHQEYIHVLVRVGVGIDSMQDLRGKRVSTGSPKSGAEITAYRLLRAAGLDPDRDIQAQRLDLAKAAGGMKTGAIDAIIWPGGLPTPTMVEITTSMRDKVKFLDVTPLLDKMNEGGPKIYEKGVIPARTYQSAGDTRTIVFPDVLLVRADFPADAACAITKLIFEQKSELDAVHPAAKDIRLETARQTGPVPLHPGAIQALAELSG
jgi:TRAP transporter TAXI family solute receptor